MGDPSRVGYPGPATPCPATCFALPKIWILSRAVDSTSYPMFSTRATACWVDWVGWVGSFHHYTISLLYNFQPHISMFRARHVSIAIGKTLVTYTQL